jgi:hypothetical protein
VCCVGATLRAPSGATAAVHPGGGITLFQVCRLTSDRGPGRLEHARERITNILNSSASR